MNPDARLRVDWLGPADGGRRSGRPRDGTYTPMFVMAGDSEHHMVTLELQKGASEALAFINLRSAVDDRLRPGARLKIMEGPHVVAWAEVLQVDPADR